MMEDFLLRWFMSISNETATKLDIFSKGLLVLCSGILISFAFMWLNNNVKGLKESKKMDFM